MTEYHLHIAQAAEQDLEDIVEYIALQLREPETARKQLGRIKAAVMSLGQMLERYPLVLDKYLAGRGIRSILVDQYLLFYNVELKKCTVNIVRVLYGKRQWEALLSEP